jgi:SAM-dependent methyltransferase
MAHTRNSYLPAAGHDWALPLYDPLVKLLGADSARISVLQRAKISPGHRVLDIGCGTGTFAIFMKSSHVDIDVVGLDPDPHALARARRKAARARADIRFDQGFSDDLPYLNGSFDHVFSTFMFHHLRAEQKKNTLAEVRRVLARGGSLHLLDFVRSDPSQRPWWAPVLNFGHLDDNSNGRILGLLHDARFVSPTNGARGSMFFGLLRTAMYEAYAPGCNSRLCAQASPNAKDPC